MEKEQVAVDEAVETVAEQNTRAYSKTVWNESTPITADKLNKIENSLTIISLLFKLKSEFFFFQYLSFVLFS